ncbi:uncharacterized protein LOC129751717 [Uranotaenia lowii]|uniref:uncharacterized protein LOC129751717 n=1 Tax=Uranotaenia lowii TaxID=190385 RepID=UPI00247A1F11|nr:uncharacterized protein LOC129751717 [Uranotaenia lowii]
MALKSLTSKLCRISRIIPSRLFHDEFSSPSPLSKKPNTQDSSSVPAAGSIANKYQVFRDVDAAVILDVEEERQMHRQLQDEIDVQENKEHNTLPNIYNGINLQRGKTGVYDIEDLITVLRLNNAEDIFVCAVPKEIKYVDFMCIVTGMSFRHMRGIAEFVRKVYKMKKGALDIIPKIEGENSREWMALDLGNIALHIFTDTAREQYDLESLWAVGARYDRECNKPAEELVELFERHSVYLNDLKPLSKENFVEKT